MAPTQIEVAAREKGVDIRTYKIIYELFNDVIERLNALLPQETLINEHGRAEVAAIFRTEPGKMIVGIKVKEGSLNPGHKLRVWRGEELIGDGVIESLQSGKSSTKELSGGQEGGMLYRGRVKLQPGDRFEAFTEELKARRIESMRA